MAPATRRAQVAAYPGVQPKVIDADGEEAFQLVIKTLAARGWKIVDQTAPGGRSGLGHIDAVDRTPIMAFPDDITIRLRPLPGQMRIDVRSASRYGRHDFGTLQSSPAWQSRPPRWRTGRFAVRAEAFPL